MASGCFCQAYSTATPYSAKKISDETLAKTQFSTSRNKLFLCVEKPRGKKVAFCGRSAVRTWWILPHLTLKFGERLVYHVYSKQSFSYFTAVGGATNAVFYIHKPSHLKGSLYVKIMLMLRVWPYFLVDKTNFR